MLAPLCGALSPAQIIDPGPPDIDIGAPTPPALLCGLHLCTPNDAEHHELCIGWTAAERLRWTVRAARLARPGAKGDGCGSTSSPAS